MLNEMEKRQDRLEWEVGSLKERYEHLNDRIGEISIRMDKQHGELISAINALRDDRSRAEGAAEAKLHMAQRDRDRMKLTSVIVTVLGLAAALGWIGSSDAKALPVSRDHETFIIADPQPVHQRGTFDH